MNKGFGHWTFGRWTLHLGGAVINAARGIGHTLANDLIKNAKPWRTILIGLFAGISVGSHAQATAVPDSNYAETGNPFVIHLIVPQSAGRPGQIDLTGWDSILPEQNILHQTEWTSDGQANRKDLTLIFFDTDTITLPPLPVHLNGKGIITTNPLDIIILPTPSPDDLVDMRSIKDIRREPAQWTDYLPWALAAGALILLVLVTAWLIKRAERKKKQAALSRTIGLPPHELAWKKLDVLAQKQLWDKGLVKEYCAELTYIIREYLEKRYFVLALESTSEEILKYLQKTDFPGKLRPGLQDLLTKADLVKFAKAMPPENFKEESMSFARKIILETKPVPVPNLQSPVR
ncbi:MAG: hypothetical protein DYG98_23915 [Haliscomenobacteraceae bacterium CHB4]|nr:hypothetical protein [Saprospiraceae bacterium]MCE7926104.1 hypothetical protein [Haliscomenobacteraceae bacterium CHB4]